MGRNVAGRNVAGRNVLWGEMSHGEKFSREETSFGEKRRIALLSSLMFPWVLYLGSNELGVESNRIEQISKWFFSNFSNNKWTSESIKLKHFRIERIQLFCLFCLWIEPNLELADQKFFEFLEWISKFFKSNSNRIDYEFFELTQYISRILWYWPATNEI